MYRRTMTRWSPPGPGLACLGGVAIQWSKSASLPAPRQSRLSLSLSLPAETPAAFARNLQGAGEQSAAGVVKWAWFSPQNHRPGGSRRAQSGRFLPNRRECLHVVPVRPTTRANLLLARDDSDISPACGLRLSCGQPLATTAVGHNCWPH